MINFFTALVGSRLHGLHSESSDYDYKHVELAPLLEKLSPFRNTEKVKQLVGDKDDCYFELTKFAQLAANNNPTMLEVLWSTDISPSFKFSSLVLTLIDKKKLLLDPIKIWYSHQGYALDQINLGVLPFWEEPGMRQEILEKKLKAVLKTDPDATLETVAASIKRRTPKALVAYVRIMQQGIDLLTMGDFSPVTTVNRDFLLDLKYNFSPEILPSFFKLKAQYEDKFNSLKPTASIQRDFKWLEQIIYEAYLMT
jgi:hypothetical protein